MIDLELVGVEIEYKVEEVLVIIKRVIRRKVE